MILTTISIFSLDKSTLTKKLKRYKLSLAP